MSTIQFETETVRIPLAVSDLESFRDWMGSEQAPEKCAISYIAGEVWVDMSKEQLYSHNHVKTEFARVLASLVKAKRLGRYFSDGLYVTNADADLATKPDGTFVSRESFDSLRVLHVEGQQEGFVELEGSPDMVLEVVSASSVEKDNEWLRNLYWQAGIPEYWLVDCRGERSEFEILRRTSRGYVSTRKVGGWVKSTVLGRSFRLMRSTDEAGHPEFTLEVRE